MTIDNSRNLSGLSVTVWFVFSALRCLSTCCTNLGDVQRAMQLAEEALSIACHCLPNNHPHLAICESMVKW